MPSVWPSLAGKSVFVTGHTGFKGSWLALWLHQLGAEVSGYALDPPSSVNNFTVSGIGELLIDDVRGDVRDSDRLAQALRRAKPDVVFHLAAQPIVLTSLRAPRETFDVNVMGTLNVLEAVRELDQPCAVLVITSDKCYRNDGNVRIFQESDALGGNDPYSASKAGAELVVEAYRASYFSHNETAGPGIRLASVRAGNVIGGGDWADDRIVPDAVRALAAGRPLIVRNPASTRPWQHVLEPLSGYLSLASHLLGDDSQAWAQAWNFGPLATAEATVAALADAVIDQWGSGRWEAEAGMTPHLEAKTLRISIDKAVTLLGWRPRWDFDETVQRTVAWYRTYYEAPTTEMRKVCLSDIEAYESS
jgi:CDP-glucose 4,6-dehydratase